MDILSKFPTSWALPCFLGSALCACESIRDSPEPDHDSTVRDSAGVVIVESTDPGWDPQTAWQVEPDPVLSIGGIDGSLDQQFLYIRDAILVDSILVVTEGSSGELRYYDLLGRLQATIGRLGEGPGEFSAAASMQLCRFSGDLVAVTDDRRSRFHVASPERRFVSTVPLPTTMGWPMWPRDCFSNGSWLVQGETHQRREGPATLNSHSIHVADENGQVTGEVVRLNGYATWWHPTLEDNVLLPFATEDQVLSSGLDIVVLRSSEGQIEWRTREGRLTRIARRIAFSRPTTSEYTDERAFYDEGLPLPEFVPMYRGAIADADGNVWARRYRIPEQTAGRYDVFDRDGIWLGTVQMFPGMTVYEIGSEYVVGMRRDSLDVEMIEMYRIVKPNRARY